MTSILNKIDLRDVVRGHLATLVHDNKEQTRNVGDLILFYAVPTVVALLVLLFQVTMSDNAIDVSTNALAILAGLLFNLLVVLQSLGLPQSGKGIAKVARRLAKQVYSNIAYAILISLFALVALLIASNYERNSLGRSVAGTVATLLILHFALTMGMVLKRMHVMLKTEFETKSAVSNDAE